MSMHLFYVVDALDIEKIGTYRNIHFFHFFLNLKHPQHKINALTHKYEKKLIYKMCNIMSSATSHITVNHVLNTKS